MTGLGEDVYTDRSTALDALTEESQRMGMYGDAPDVEKMVAEASAALIARRSGLSMDDTRHIVTAPEFWRYATCIKGDVRAALESLGIPLSVLADLKAGKLRVAEAYAETRPCPKCGIERTMLERCAAEDCPDAWVFDAAPKTPEAAR